jgi:hypothetical protein
MVTEHDVSAGAVAFWYVRAFAATPIHLGGELAYHLAVGPRDRPPPFRVGGGLRTAAPAPSVPVEGYLHVQVQGKFGVWRPASGPEVGVSGFTQPTPSTRAPDDGIGSQAVDQVGPAYVAFTASPLRFAIGRWTLSAIDVHLGTTFPPFGGAARFQVGLVQLGFAL